MKRNTKGFTLIELLAVIVILAIIALIATPIVLNLIERARKGAAQDSTYGIRKAAQLYYQTSLIDDPTGFKETTITFNGSGDYTGSDGNAITKATLVEKGFEIDGTIPESGSIKITVDGKVSTVTPLKINNWYCPFTDTGVISCSKTASA